MQYPQDEWGQQDGGLNGGKGSGRRSGGGSGWNALFTVTAIVIVTAFSMGMSWLTRNVDERPVWMMGLIFMVPTAALMLGTMLVEGATSYMTPDTSRKPQIRLAVIVTLATFLVACICDLIYLQGFKKELEPAKNEITPARASERMILIWDDTASMQENGAHDRAAAAAGQLLDSLPGTAQAAMISGGKTIPFGTVSGAQRQRMDALIAAEPSAGGMYFGDAFAAAAALAEEAGGQEPVRIVFFSDGAHAWDANGTDPGPAVLGRDRIRLYWVLLDRVPEEMEEILRIPGKSQILTPENVRKAAEGMETVRYQERVAPAEVPKEIRLQQDLIRNRDQSAKIITCVMMILEGLSLGICLSLMYSSAGQFRAQYIISPLMGALSFILLKYVMSTEDMSTWWIREGLSFSLLGVVIMMKNSFIRKPVSVQADGGWENGSDAGGW